MIRKVIDKHYKILKKIGTGATGDVYKVKNLKDNKVYALKILSKKKISSETVQRFKREFRLLTQLRHPNLCSVYDFGILKNGRTYFTMDYIDGKNIFQYTKNLPHKQIYPLIVQLCRALEYIHSKGLIHYDIKPGNVLIAKADKKPHAQSPMPQARLLDFGLAGEHRIKGGGLIKGTFPYIAPEVIKGLAIDHRADLYSLGVLLYEIFTRRPFRVDKKGSFVTLIKQRIDWQSRPPSTITSGIPKRTEQLILKLLSFEPAERFNRGNEIIKEISKISDLKFELETEKTLESYLLSSRFVGRTKEMNLLKSFYKNARKGEGKIILVTGEAGIGKSRLLNEFKIFTQLERSYCFRGYADKDKIKPLEPFHDIFGELINYISNGSKFKTSLAVLYKMFPDLPDGVLRKKLPTLTPLGPEQEKLRNFEALYELITHIASNLGELVILLEDLHWADEMSIQFLEYLGRNLAGKNILICGTSRSAGLTSNPALNKMIANLKNMGQISQIGLKPLNFNNLYVFLDSTITPGSNSRQLARYLMEKTSGNPFFVEEIMRIMLQKRKVSIGEPIELTHFKKASIPEKIEDIVLRRTQDLDINEQKIVTFSVILLKNFRYEVMKQLTRLSDTELTRSLWNLQRKQILIQKNNTYRFYHETLSEVLSKRFSSQKKRELNYHVGQVLEKITKKNIEKYVEDLAHYFINARVRKKGVKYGLWAAKKSAERYAHEQTIKFYKGVLHLLGTKEKKLRFEIYQELAKTEVYVDHYDEAIKYYKRIFGLKTGSTETKIRIYISLGNVYWKIGEHGKALRIYRQGAQLLKKMKHGALKILLETNVHVRICKAYQIMGKYKHARMFNFDNLKFPKHIKSKKLIRLLANICYNLHIMENYRGKYDRVDSNKGISYCKKAYEYYKKIKDEEGIGSVFNNLGVDYHERLEFQKAIYYYQKAMKVFEKISVYSGVATVLRNLGNIMSSLGNYAKAIEYLQRALYISKKIGNPSMAGDVLFELGVSFISLCDYKKAKEHLEEAIRVCDVIGWEEKKLYAVQALGTVYRLIGEYTIALKHYKKSLKFFEAIKHQQGLVDSYYCIGILFTELGKLSTAKKYISDALRIATTIERKNMICECCLHLSKLNIIKQDYAFAITQCKKGMNIAKQIKMKKLLNWLSISASEIFYRTNEYSKGLSFANRAIKATKQMNTKDLYIEALIMKVKNGIGSGSLSKSEAILILNEAKKVAEQIRCPEILWKVYFTYGKFLQANKLNTRASRYYKKCIKIFKHNINKIKIDPYRRSYLKRSDRQRVFASIVEI